MRRRIAVIAALCAAAAVSVGCCMLAKKPEPAPAPSVACEHDALGEFNCADKE